MDDDSWIFHVISSRKRRMCYREMLPVQLEKKRVCSRNKPCARKRLCAIGKTVSTIRAFGICSNIRPMINSNI